MNFRDCVVKDRLIHLKNTQKGSKKSVVLNISKKLINFLCIQECVSKCECVCVGDSVYVSCKLG